MYIESGDTVAVISENSTKDAPYHTTYHQQQQQQQGERGGGEITTHVPPGSIMMTTFHDRPTEGDNNHTNIHKNHHSANGSCSDTDSDMDQNNNHHTGSHYNESHRTATTSRTKPPSNEQLLGVAFLTFFTFATVQMIFALHIAHSQAMMGDSAAMLVDAFTYLFNYIAERQKAAVQDQNRNDGNDGKDVPNCNSNYNNNNTDIVHDTDRNGRNNTVAAATLLLQKQAYEQQRQDRKMVLQLEIIPPVVSVTTLIIVTIVVVQKAVHILILDTHRSKAQQTIPNLRLMFLFSCFNLVLDFVNVMCFARAKHCCGYHTTVTTTTSPNTNQNHHCHQRQYCTNGDKISNNHNDDGDEENSAHSGTHLLDDTITTDVRILQTPQPQQHPSSNILQQVAHPMVATRGYSHVPNIDAVTMSSNGINQDNGCCMTSSVNGANVTLPQNTAYENNTFVIHDKGENDDDDESHVIVEDYDRYVELLQHNHTRTTTNVDQIHNSDVDNETNQDHSNHNRHLHSEHDEEDDDTTNLNMCSAYTHVFADTLRSIAVIIAAIVAELVPQITPEVADSTAAILVSILILFSLVPLVQGLMNSGRELQIIYREEKLDTMATMHATPITMDHIELT